MTIKKLTVAAAIAVGIATCSLNSAMAACPISGGSCGGACPCQNVMTPATAPCPICGQSSGTCGCQAKTPCGNTAPCNCAPACDCAPACPTPCCKPAVPACATCPNTSCNDLDMKQVYGYPNAIYGDNNYVGEQTNAIYSTESAFSPDACDKLGLTTAGYGVSGLNGMTGAACGFDSGCGSHAMVAPCECDGGAIVHRGCKTDCGAPIITGAACGCETGAACGSGCNSAYDGSCPITIQTSNSRDAIKKSFVPFQTSEMTGAAAPSGCSCGCGGAAPLINAFPDVPNGYWAACPIDKLAMNNVVVGYPDRLFRPGRNVSRAEFATMMVKGYNLNCAGLESKSLFKDVPKHNWANPLIAKAVEEGIMCGYPNNIFKPKQPVSRVEALTAMAHGINCDISCDKAQQILSQYCDGSQIPTWAQIPVAKALETGVLKTSQNPTMINPCKDASRAEIADMLQNVRVTIGYDSNPKTACDCPAPAIAASPCCPKTAYMESNEMVKIPTLQLKFMDEINAKSSHVGQQFATTTLEAVTINGKVYPCGSRVNGKIVEVVRPSGCCKGALKLAFTEIQDSCGCKTDLPKQILTAQLNCVRTQNIFSRIIQTPFTLVGGLIGTTGRTIGGMIANAGNAVENVSAGAGIASGEVLQGQFRAAGRSIQDATKEAIIAPVDFARTALSGATGLFQTTADEVAYLVDPNGSKISAINPKEKITIAFGCSGK